MTHLIDKDALTVEIKKLKGKVDDESSYCNGWQQALRMLEIALDAIEVKEIPKWKKTMHDNGCWSCEIGVNPSKRLYEYEHYTINADELFKLLDKEE